jgi:factor associated with neutral sphingomyelinase activation
MEIFFNENSCSGGDSGGGVAEGASAFFTFHSTELRDKVVSMFLQQLGVSISFHLTQVLD